MNKREIYESIVAEVEADISLIKPDTTKGYIETVQTGSTTITLPEGVLLKTPTSAFADYAVRDNVLTKAMESEEFAFVLINKIGNTVKSKTPSKSVTQDDIEALVSANQISVMWEQFGISQVISALVHELIEQYNLVEPSLNKITNKLMEARNYFPFAQTRKDLLKDFNQDDKISKELDNE